ncbi:hypothetical protein PP707_06420 [Acetobacter pasteurianus]|nr:hypothetical protein [Acetobacter pasteurianus]
MTISFWSLVTDGYAGENFCKVRHIYKPSPVTSNQTSNMQWYHTYGTLV